MNSSAPKSPHVTIFSRVPPGVLYFIFVLCGFLLLVSTALVVYICRRRRSLRHEHHETATSHPEDTQSGIKHHDEASPIPVTVERVSTLQVVTNTMSSQTSGNLAELASDHLEHSSETQHLSFQSARRLSRELEDCRNQCASPTPFQAPAKRPSCSPTSLGIGNKSSGRTVSLPLVRSGSEKLGRPEISRSQPDLRLALNRLETGSNGDQMSPTIAPRLSFDSSNLEHTSRKLQKGGPSQRSQQSPTPPIMSPASEAIRPPTPLNSMSMLPAPACSGWFDSSSSEESEKQSSRSKWKKKIARR
jgi:hypothetical protein